VVARFHGHAPTTPRPLWAEGQRALLRLLGDVRDQLDEWLRRNLTDPEANAKVAGIAADLGCSLTHLAIAWCAANPHVSTVITGASRPE
jgi:aryl-alcohol dehydrogenase-like predicted oxidoreductase